jgi:hypothetical protein
MTHPFARVRRGKSPAAGFESPAGGVVVLLAMTRPANLRYGKSRPVDSTAAGRGAYSPAFNSQTGWIWRQAYES